MGKRKALLLVFATAIISGFTIFLNKYGVTGINSSVYAFARSVAVSIFLFAAIVAIGNFSRLRQLKYKEWLKLAFVGLMGGSIPFLLFFRGLQLSSPATSSFIHKLMFVFVAVMAFFFLKEKSRFEVYAAGLFLIAGNYALLKIARFDLGYGSMLVLAATIFWAAENTYAKYLLKSLDGTTVAFGRMFFGSLFILISLVFTGEITLILSINQDQIWWILLTSALLFGYTMTWYNGLKHMDATLATSILLLGSPITILLNYFFAHAKISAYDIIGSLLIFAGIAIIVRFYVRASRKNHGKAISTA